MKYLLIILFLFSFRAIRAQNTDSTPIDSLGKYSYFIYGMISENQSVQSTGFFINIKKQLYLISASHVFTGIGINNTRIVNYPDTLSIRIKNDKDNPVFIKINISEIKKKAKKIEYYSSPDVYAYPIKTPKNIKIYSIENLNRLKLPCDSIKNFITYGYPLIEKANKKNFTKFPPTMNKGTLVNNYCVYFIYSDIKVKDTINYLINARGLKEGFSGAPVFIVHQNKAYFAGLIGGGTDGQSAAVVRPRFVLKKVL